MLLQVLPAVRLLVQAARAVRLQVQVQVAPPPYQ
jgi:hypothetical protein